MVLDANSAKVALLQKLRTRSVFHGDFTLASGAKSKYYIDCRLTTLDPEGAWLVGQTMHDLIRREQAARGVDVRAVGGLTMGADPISLAIGMYSHFAKDAKVLQVFCVRKAPKAHGQTRLIEGNFQKGDSVVVIEDVITRGESASAAIKAVEQEGGKVQFVAALVDREEGGRGKIEGMGHPVVAVFSKSELLEK
ncbi:MAG: orotate phosphoribosyltransferase [Verrucomicrobia bacterium]|nr:MAG: orotate phosphoribosyltransferase [Verrucomicrobiota bacterium]